MVGGKLPAGRIIDGKDILALMKGEPGAKSPHEAFYYYYRNDLQAVRQGPWKIKLETTIKYDSVYHFFGPKDGKVGERLFNLDTDIGEQKTVLKDHPDIAGKLHSLADKIRQDIGDERTGVKGPNVRPVGYIGDFQTAPPAKQPVQNTGSQ
jgi:arylsulfatase A